MGEIDLEFIAIGSRVRLRCGGEGKYIEKKWLELGSSSKYVYVIEDEVGNKWSVWGNGRCHSDREERMDVVEVIGMKGEGDEYLERLNELSTENIVLGRVIDRVLWKVCGGSCLAVVLGDKCLGCILEDRGERVKCLRGKLEGMVKVEMREEVSCG